MSTDLRAIAARTLAEVPMNTAFARAVVEETVAGELWADRAEDPRAFHAVHPYGMSLVWGDAVDEALDLVVAYLRERADEGQGEWLQVDPRWDAIDWDDTLDAVPFEDHDQLAGGERVVRHTRVNFAFDAGAFWERRDEHLPVEPWQVRRTVRADFDWPGSVVPSEFWPDADTFLANGGGWVLADGPQVAAMAFASYRAGRQVELGIETAPDWRRRAPRDDRRGGHDRQPARLAPDARVVVPRGQRRLVPARDDPGLPPHAPPAVLPRAGRDRAADASVRLAPRRHRPAPATQDRHRRARVARPARLVRNPCDPRRLTARPRGENLARTTSAGGADVRAAARGTARGA
ncbi:MAG: GNAT family N-acetyltransferase [Cellulomonas sp.]|nr:hypothetical protein [Cellulomonas sp.]MCR6649233.1 GNAT family N-acetyltransferase [Cellulomonas sp.]